MTEPSFEELPLSWGQSGLWVVEQLEPGNPASVIAAAGRLLSPLEPERLRGALRWLVARHGALRTTFGLSGGEPRQRVWSWLEPEFVERSLAEASPTELRAALQHEAFRPFDLERGPLLRMALVERSLERGGRETFLVVAIHHLVADFWSLGLLVEELGRLLAGEPLEAVAEVGPARLLELERQSLAGGRGERLRRYWRERLEGRPLETELPYDHPRPAEADWRALRAEAHLEPAALARLEALAREHPCSLFVLVAAAYAALLARWSGSRDLLFATPTRGQRTPELARVVGYLVNPVVLRLALAPGATFESLLAETRRAALGALRHLALPFPLLVEELGGAGASGRAAVTDCFFSFEQAPPGSADSLVGFALGLPGHTLESGGLQLASVPLPCPAAQFDLSLAAGPTSRGLALVLVGRRSLFDATTLARWVGQAERLLRGALEAPGVPLEALPLLAAGERQQLLWEWNQDALEPEAAADAVARVAEQARQKPDKVALASAAGELSYGALAERVSRLAGELRARGLGPEAPVALCLERGLALPIAQLAVLAAGGCYLPLDPAYPRERLLAMLEDGGARWLLTERSLAELLPGSIGPERLFLSPDGELLGAAGERPAGAAWAEPGLESSLAYILFTSGSTGRPKGVAIERRSLACRARWAAAAYPGQELDGVLAGTSVCFDLSVFEILMTLAAGGTVVLARDVLALPGHPERARVRLLNSVPSAVAELVRAGAVPPTVATVNLAGEPLPPELARALLESGREVHDLYGPSEDTTYSTGWRAVPGERIRIGRPLPGTRLFLFDRAGWPVPLGVAGEICLGGSGLARGYLGRPGLTATRFVPDALSGQAGARLYRTGDRGRLLVDGTVEYLGRLDRQVKLRGFRIELGEIEAALDHLEAVAEAAAGVVEIAGEPALAAWVVPTPGFPAEPEELRSALGARLPAFMVPGHWVLLEALPRLPNGKLDRRRLPAPEPRAGALPGEPPADPLEALLAELFAEGLGAPALGREAHFFRLGGHSLSALRLVGRVTERLGIQLGLADVFQAPTVAALTERVRAARRSALPPLPRQAPAAFPLTAGQRRLWLLSRLDPSSAAYHMAGALRIAGELDVPALAAALGDLLHRHPSLRLGIELRAGRPWARVEERPRLPLAALALDALPSERAEALLAASLSSWGRRPFELERAPLARALLVRLAPGEQVLALCLHHLVADGRSLELLLAELPRLYRLRRGEELEAPPPPRVHPGDAAAWLESVPGEEERGRQLEAWRRELGGGVERLELPLDRPWPAVLSSRGRRLRRPLPPALWQAVENLAARVGSTRFLVLLAAFEAFLARWTGRPRGVLATPLDTRNRPELEGVVGFFVQTLLLPFDLEPGASLLAQGVVEQGLGERSPQPSPPPSPGGHGGPPLRPSRERGLEGSTVSGFPLARAVGVGGLGEGDRGGEGSGGARVSAAAASHPGASLLSLVDQAGRCFAFACANSDIAFDRVWAEVAGREAEGAGGGEVFFAVEGAGAPPVLPGAATSWLEVELGAARAPLSFVLRGGEGGVEVVAEYSTELFDRTTLERLLVRWEIWLGSLLAGPELPLVHHDWLSLAERHQLVAEWGPGPLALEAPDPLFGFVALAREKPHAVAVAGEEEALSYGELLARAGSLAARLARLGAGPEQVVALCLPRSVELVVAALATLYCGAAYQPMDPDQPAERLRLQLEAPAPLAVLVPAGGAVADRLGPLPGVAVLAVGERAGTEEPLPAPVPVAAGGLGYVIFTSGSTGRPKGTELPRRGLANLVAWHRRVHPSGPGERTTLLAGPGFDASVWELWPPLAGGATLVIPPPEVLLSPRGLGEWLVSRRITSSFLPTPLAEALIALGLPEGGLLTRLLVGGDRLRRGPAAGLPFALVNHYGPTETSVVASWLALQPGAAEASPSIGRAVDGLALAVVDRHGEPVPIGVAGELAISGRGLARGYRGRPALTAERFRPDPLALEPGGRRYHSGDRVRFLPDGRLDFLGRLDRQVKVRGQRIEPGEIEAALLGLPGVLEAAVELQPFGPGERALVAYLAVSGRAESGPETAAALTGRLPAAMIPAAFVFLPRLPTNASGKVDRRALPPPRPAEAQAEDPPRGPLEEALAGIWRELLALPSVGRSESFFALGGHSLLVAELAARVEARFGVALKLPELFARPTLAALAAAVARAQGEQGARAAIPRLDRSRRTAQTLQQELLARPRAARGGQLPRSSS